MKLERLLRPRTIAVFGGRDAQAVIEQCDRFGFEGEVWPVSPRRETLAGRRCFSSVEALPGPPDAAFVGVNRHGTIAIVEALAKAGAGGAVAYASGFSEAGDDVGVALNRALLEAAGDMPVIGPNCYGLINYLDGALLWPNQHGGVPLGPQASGVAIVTQSSNIAINMTMQRRALPIAYTVTAGNQAQIGLSDIAAGLLEDDRISALGLHIEGFDDIAAFERMAMRARELRKPIVAMKVGRSEQARAAAVSHTASLTGSDAAADAFLRRLGVARVDSIPAFIETLKLLHLCGPLDSYDISSMSCSGGEAGLMADTAVGTRLTYRALDDNSADTIKAALGPLVTPANPLDYHTFAWGDEAAMQQAFGAVVGQSFALNLLVLDFPRSDRCADDEWWPPVRAFQQALADHRAKGAVVASLPENLPEQWAQDLIARGIVPLADIGVAMAAIEAAARVGEAWRSDAPPPLWRNDAIPAGSTVLDEAAAKAMLARFGIRVPTGHCVNSVNAAVTAANELGYPVALKALGVAHKTETNAVRLGLSDADAVRDAAAELLSLHKDLLIEEQVPVPAVELLVGVTRDEPFGLVMTIASGGVHTEILRDTATILLPATRTDFETALQSLKCAPLLDGFRGGAPADSTAAVDAMLAIAELARSESQRLLELDVNPLMVCERNLGAFAADALIVLCDRLPPESP